MLVQAIHTAGTNADATTDAAASNPSQEDHTQYIQQIPPLLEYIRV